VHDRAVLDGLERQLGAAVAGTTIGTVVLGWQEDRFLSESTSVG
jgi:hypothetical protein